MLENPLYKHLLIFFGFVFAILFMLYFWLRFYTDHNKMVQMDNFTNLSLEKAAQLCKKNNFQILVIDSMFVVGKPGGIILDQNPKPNAEVKQNRKVYVTITKYNADMVKLSDLPQLYGNEYTQKEAELKLRDINCRIRGKKYDVGEPNHILEVYYNNQLVIDKSLFLKNIEIKKGDFLEFVVSSKNEGEIDVPDLKCKTVAEAEFILSQYNLSIGEFITKGSISDTSNAYIILQDPKFEPDSKINIGSKVNVTIIQGKPGFCN